MIWIRFITKSVLKRNVSTMFQKELSYMECCSKILHIRNYLILFMNNLNISSIFLKITMKNECCKHIEPVKLFMCWFLVFKVYVSEIYLRLFELYCLCKDADHASLTAPGALVWHVCFAITNILMKVAYVCTSKYILFIC